MTAIADDVHYQTLISAVGSALDRVEYWLGESDAVMAAVSGATVRKLLTHPDAKNYPCDLAWRRMLLRFDVLRPRLGAPPMLLADFIDHQAGVLLVEASRAAERAQRSS